MWGEYWTHEEINECGSVIARYESCEELNARVRSTGVGVNTTPLAISWMCRPSAQAGWSGREGRLRSHASSQTAEQMVCRLHAYSWAAADHLNQGPRSARVRSASRFHNKPYTNLFPSILTDAPLPRKRSGSLSHPGIMDERKRECSAGERAKQRQSF